MNKKAIVIGGGFSGMACASTLAQAGYQVTLIEKNAELGGKCRSYREDDFLFDIGPSWYWMPDVFEEYFKKFGYSSQDFFELIQLEPSYQVIFDDEIVSIPSKFSELQQLFEDYEVGASVNLERYVNEGRYNYQKIINGLINPSSPFTSPLNMEERIMKSLVQSNMQPSFSEYIKKYFTHPKIQRILEFPILFLGAKPRETPALYSLMNYADLILGTFYPKGGMSRVSNAFQRIAQEQGVDVYLNQSLKEITVKGDKITTIKTTHHTFSDFDVLISSADYHHTESLLSNPSYKNYDETYWEKAKVSPSCFIFFLGINKKIDKLQHHNLFLDADLEEHSKDIFESKKYPTYPIFYVSVTSKTDETAPPGMENLFILIPVASGLEDTDEIREEYYTMVIKRMEEKLNDTIKDHVIYKKSFSIRDFISEYNSYQGNAYGLTNTSTQTLLEKPKIKNDKIKNMFYCGQMSVPGPGMPPTIISGQLAANYILNKFPIYDKELKIKL